MSNEFIIREYRNEDFDAVTILWRVSREKSIPEFQLEKGHFFFEDRDYFQKQIVKNNQIWVVESQNYPVGFMAMNNDFVDQLYIDPDHQRRGIGRSLLRSEEHTSELQSPCNLVCRLLLEKKNFKCIKSL